MFKYKYSKLYWFLRDFEFLKVYFSPFKFFLPTLYVGKTAVGVPVFLPRRWIKLTYKEALERAIKSINNPNYVQRSFDCWVEYHKKHQKPIPLKIGFSFCGLIWKTKWRSTDFRHEYNPVWSFVAFGYQIALTFRPENDCHYWESYLYYTYATDKTKTVKERIEQARKEFPNTWNTYSNGEKIKINYWELVLKDRYKIQKSN